MKKFIAMIVAAAMILSLAAIPAFAENEAPVTFTLSSVNAQPGEEVTVSLGITGEYEAHGLNMKVYYDQAQLTPVKYSVGEIFNAAKDLNGTVIIDVKTIPGACAIGFMGPTDPMTGEGELCTFTFTVGEDVEVGTDIDLKIEVTEFFNEPINEPKTDIEFGKADGVITVAEEPVTEEPVTDEPVETEEPTGEPTETEEPGEPTGEPTESEEPGETTGPAGPGAPSTGAVSLIGLGVVAAIAGSGVVLFKKKED